MIKTNLKPKILEKYTPEDIADILDISIHSVDSEFTIILLNALSKLPMNVVDWVADNVYFVSSIECDAFYKNKKELKPWKAGIVFLCETLRKKPAEEQAFTIAHEIAHAKLRHKGAHTAVEDISKRQEEEADKLAKKWLRVRH